jgi:hypothetical protein
MLVAIVAAAAVAVAVVVKEKLRVVNSLFPIKYSSAYLLLL